LALGFVIVTVFFFYVEIYTAKEFFDDWKDQDFLGKGDLDTV
jgi:hypothetical protein